MSGKAEEWGIMPAHFYATSIAKMLFGALPLLLLGLVWASLLVFSGEKGGVWHNKALQRCVGDVSRTLGPGVVSLIAVLSTVGHKVCPPFRSTVVVLSDDRNGASSSTPSPPLTSSRRPQPRRSCTSPRAHCASSLA